MTLRTQSAWLWCICSAREYGHACVNVLVRLSADKQARLSLNERLMSNVPTEVQQLMNLEQGSWGNIGV